MIYRSLPWNTLFTSFAHIDRFSWLYYTAYDWFYFCLHNVNGRYLRWKIRRKKHSSSLMLKLLTDIPIHWIDFSMVKHQRNPKNIDNEINSKVSCYLLIEFSTFSLFYYSLLFKPHGFLFIRCSPLIFNHKQQQYFFPLGNSWNKQFLFIH